MPTLPRPVIARAGACGLALLAGCAAAPLPDEALARRRDELAQAERAFAHSMAARDFAAFSAFVADDAVFLGGAQPLRGRTAVLAAWRRFFDGPQAPFSWAPDQAEVALGGTLGHTSGPVRDAQGRLFARFYSTWRREPDGRWRVLLDNGVDVAEDGRARVP